MQRFDFIVTDKSGHRFRTSVESRNEDNAWDYMYENYPDADYIESF